MSSAYARRALPTLSTELYSRDLCNERRSKRIVYFSASNKKKLLGTIGGE